MSDAVRNVPINCFDISCGVINCQRALIASVMRYN